MAILQRLSDDELGALAQRVLAPVMGDLGFRGIEVRHRDTYTDEPSLHIGLRVDADVPAPFDPMRFNRFHLAFFDAMLDAGDERFPHLSLARDGDDQPEPEPIPVDP